MTQPLIVRTPPASADGNCRKGALAGPRTTRPDGSNCDPWQGHV